MWLIEAHSNNFYLTRDGVTISIPAGGPGYHLMYQILSQASSDNKIATPAFPTQATIDEMVKQFRTLHPPLTVINLKDFGL